MRRREFMSLLGGGAAARPLGARSQQLAPPAIGILDNVTAAATANRIAAFRRSLNEVGFVEGRNVAMEFRFAENQLDRLPSLAADLVRRRVAAIVTNGFAALAAAKTATSTIPIVFITGADPVEAGYVTSLNRPGGNVTGISFTAASIDPKRLELLHELIPKPAIIAALMDPSISRLESSLHAIEEAARTLGRQIFVVQARTEREFSTAFGAIAQAGAGALFVNSGAFFNSHRRQLVAFAIRHGLPASYGLREYVLAGGLMSYGASDTEAYRRGGLYVGRILKGEKPGDLPVELPTRYELVFNVATAKALNIDIPPTLLALADEVVE